MVNLTAIELISRFLNSQPRIRPMKPWSRRVRLDSSNVRPSYLRKIISQLRQILVLVSGNEVIEMLKDVLTVNEQEQLTLPKYKEALANLTDHYKDTQLKQRHHIIRPIRRANFRYTQVRRLGFNVSKGLWKTCFNSNERNLDGGKPLPTYLRNAIDEYLKSRSAIASNRLCKNQDKSNNETYKAIIPARYLDDNKTELYRTFPLKNQLSKSSFFKYLNVTGQYKKAFRWTDLCEYCEDEKTMRRKVAAVLREEDYEVSLTYNIEVLKKHFKDRALNLHEHLKNIYDLDVRISTEANYEKYKNIVILLTDYEALIFHKNVAHCQRIAYNRQRKSVDELRGKLLIELDFKQKIVIGISPRQISCEFYEGLKRSCLSLGVYYLDENDKIQLVNFDIISSDLDQKGYEAVRGFRILRSQLFFQIIDKPEYIVWADCGTHFRNNELLGYLMKELAEQHIHVNLNFFAESHGKNSRDAHFSHISKFIEAESLVRKLETSQDIVDLIINRQRIANENNPKLEKHIKTHAFALESDYDVIYRNQFREMRTLHIQNLMSFYNYKTLNNNFELFTSVLSNENENIKLDIRGMGSHATFRVIPPIENVENTLQNYVTLHQKKTRIHASMIEIKLKKNEDERVNDFYNYFSLNVEPDPNNNDNENNSDNNNRINNNNNNNLNIETIKLTPIYCSDKIKKMKRRKDETTDRIVPPCHDCKVICSYRIEDILHPTHGLTQNTLNKELSLHNHPKSRDIIVGNESHKRLTHEAARELADHYIHAHNFKEPLFYA